MFDDIEYNKKKPLDNDLIFVFDLDQNIFLNKNNQIPLYYEISSFYDNNQDLFCFAKIDNQDCFLLPYEHLYEKNNLTSVYMKQAWYYILETSIAKIAIKGCHINHWLLTNKYCGKCSNVLSHSSQELALYCQKCNRTLFPKISPCIMVLIIKGDQILLARSPHFIKNMYSPLAGFIEAGETAEQAIHREVYEEVGLKVKNIRYVKSQPWPFPNSLILGYIAEYDSGSISIDPKEIEKADWFYKHDLPELSDKQSISRQLIDFYINKSSLAKCLVNNKETKRV
jgi:NADH pyrophosphatase NudC (nudix superfamily)